MRYLVTGGAGFIGSHLIELLVSKGHEVLCLDDLSTGYGSNLSSVISKIDFYNEKVELFDFNQLGKIDAIIHLAAQASVPISITNFYSSSTSNILSSLKVIDYCRLKKIPIIYASSAAVYGNLDFGNDESENVNILSPYAADKYALELYSKIAHNIYQLSSIGLRFFNVYGPRQDPKSPYSGVISIFSDRLKKRKNITINGGYQTRDFIYVKDVADVIYKAIEIASSNLVCEVSNVLTGNSITIDSLAMEMTKFIDSKTEINYLKLQPSDPEHSNGSTIKMTKLFEVNIGNFKKLNEGLLKTFQSI
jgi:UDP-glucose 4-epimerase